MKSIFKLIFLAFFLSSCGGGGGGANTASALKSSANHYVEKYQIPGLLAGVWIPGKAPIVLELGLSNIATSQPAQRSDHARIASITKSFTVTVLLQLAQEGRIDLQKPLHFYLPDLVVENNDATVSDLATMRSGIFDYPQDPIFVADFLANPLKQVTDVFLVDAANRNQPYFAPGAGWHYSNTNTVILGILIEKVTGNTVAQEITNRIILPLGLSQTSYPQTVDMPVPFLSGYIFGSSEDFTAINPSYTSASGAMISTLDDLRTWAKALGEGSLLSKETQQLRLQSLVPIVFSPCLDTDLSRPERICPEYDKYGLGLGEINGWIGHTGSYIGYQLLTMYSPKSKAVVVIIINQSNQGEGVHVPTDLFKEWTQLLKIAA